MSRDGVTGENWALIPARSGSKGIKDKNLQRVFGHSILAWSILAARATNCIDRVFVSTDSSDYMVEAKRYGAETPFVRPPELATDKSTDLEVVQHFLNWAIHNSIPIPTILVHLRPTTPIRDPKVVCSAIKVSISRRNDASALRSVHKSAESPFKWFRQDQSGFLTTLDGSRALDASNSARQSFPTVYVPNGYVDVLYPSQVLATGRIHGDAVLPFETLPVIEVDTQIELDLIRKVGALPPQLLGEAHRIEGASDL